MNEESGGRERMGEELKETRTQVEGGRAEREWEIEGGDG